MSKKTKRYGGSVRKDGYDPKRPERLIGEIFPNMTTEQSDAMKEVFTTRNRFEAILKTVNNDPNRNTKDS
jgi:hypothetical protein